MFITQSKLITANKTLIAQNITIGELSASTDIPIEFKKFKIKEFIYKSKYYKNTKKRLYIKKKNIKFI